MADYLVKFRVNSIAGAVQERVVQATSGANARKVIEAQFSGAKITWSGPPKKL